VGGDESRSTFNSYFGPLSLANWSLLEDSIQVAEFEFADNPQMFTFTL